MARSVHRGAGEICGIPPVQSSRSDGTEYALYTVRNLDITTTMNRLTRILMPGLAAGLGLWAVAAETHDPALPASELPADVVQSCVPASGEAADLCLQASDFDSRWVGRSRQGSIFIVMRPGCVGTTCRAWLVEKSDHGARALLAVNGQYQLSRDRQAYPTVQVRAVLPDQREQVSRYEWQGSRYVRTDLRVVYSVDGVACGDREQCRAAARDAFRQQNIDRGVKIFERVHGVSWI